jgi:rod shape-determining protein MreD
MIRSWAFWLMLWLCLALSIIDIPPAASAARPLWIPLFIAYFALRDPEQSLFVATFFLGLLMDGVLNTPFGSHGLAWVPLVYACLRLRSLWLLMPTWQTTPLLGLLWLLSTFVLFWLDGAMSRPTDTALRWLPVLSTMVCWPLWVWFLDHTLPRHAVEE